MAKKITKPPKNTEKSERVAKIRDVFCDNDNRIFAEKLGKDESYTSQICNGSKVIGGNLIETILNAFPKVDANWLIKGLGNMIVNEQNIGDVNNSGIQINHIGNGDTYNINDIQPLVFKLQEKVDEQSELIRQIIKVMAE